MRKQKEIAELVVTGLEKVITRLNDEVTDRDVVLVEGKRDSRALRLAGFRGPILTLNRHGGETVLVDEISSLRSVVLLLDLDSEGEERMNRIARKLSARGCKVNTSFRNALLRETLGRIRQIEELSRWVQHLNQRVS